MADNIISINTLLEEMALTIPDYQRPYKWTVKNISELLSDIETAIYEAGKNRSFRYRIGTIILHEKEKDVYDVVDGQQRIISLVLLKLVLDPNCNCSILKTEFNNKISQQNIHNNFLFINDWFLLKDDAYKDRIINAFDNTLEVVIISVKKVSEAFQLFDSQNTRGKALDPHDLLKAYHLRAMKDFPYEMQHAVTKWEAVDSKRIRDLFNSNLFPILNWSKLSKTVNFTDKEIDVYKGIPENSYYTYARRAKNAMPYFQLTEPFVEGKDFFEMVEHYLELLSDIEKEIDTNKSFDEMKSVFKNSDNSIGFIYAKELFYCALLCYYDKFRNFDEQAVKKMFTWAMMLRVDMENLGFDSINKYAIGESVERYSNNIAMFSKIKNARLHTEISNLQINIIRKDGKAQAPKWDTLYYDLISLNGMDKGGGK